MTKYVWVKSVSTWQFYSSLRQEKTTPVFCPVLQSFLYLAWYMTMSILGHYNNFFFAAHLLDIAMGFKTLRTILSSVTHNGKQVNSSKANYSFLIYFFALESLFLVAPFCLYMAADEYILFVPSLQALNITCFLLVGVNCRPVSSGGVPLHSGGLQFLPEILQQEWRWRTTWYEVWWYADSEYTSTSVNT